MKFDYTIIERRVTRARLQFKDGALRIIVPKGKRHLAPAMIARYSSWIEKRIVEHNQFTTISETLELADRSEKQLLILVDQLVKADGDLLSVVPRKIQYRLMKRRWGSCSSARVITFNRKLKFLPEPLVRFVVYHELCHLRIPAHNAAFKQLVKYQFENPKQYNMQLKLYNQILNNL